MRIAGITIPEEKRIEIGLTEIYGIGRSRARKILDEAGVSPDKRPKDVTSEEENKVRKVIDGVKVEGELKREVSANIKRLKDIESYRGERHKKNLPVRGQNTRTNTRVVPSGGIGAIHRQRKTMGSGKRKVEKK